MENKEQHEEAKTTEEQVKESAVETAENLSENQEEGEKNEQLKLQNELAEQKDKYIRLYSEFENFRRRTAKEKIEMTQSANEQLIRSLLPVVDDFDRAEKVFKDAKDKEIEGIFLIQNKLKKVLEQYGVKAMTVGSGSEFDSDFHEAISQVPAPDEKLKGKIVDVVEKGYMLNEKVIRFAKVVVGG